MEQRAIEVRVFDRKGDELEERTFHRLRRAMAFIEEQLVLRRDLRIKHVREHTLGTPMQSRHTPFSED